MKRLALTSFRSHGSVTAKDRIEIIEYERNEYVLEGVAGQFLGGIKSAFKHGTSKSTNVQNVESLFSSSHVDKG